MSESHEFWWVKERSTGELTIAKRIVAENFGEPKVWWDGFGGHFPDWMDDVDFSELFEAVVPVSEP